MSVVKKAKKQLMRLFLPCARSTSAQTTFHISKQQRKLSDDMACIRFSEESARRRKELICWLGQPVRIDVGTWPGQEGGLVVLTLTPLEGFIHLVADPAACIREYGSYHVSICQRKLVSQSELDELC